MTQLYFDKRHSVTSVLTADVAQYRLVGFDGAHATGAGGVNDAQGISEQAGSAGDAISLVTGYSALVEAGGSIAIGDRLAPAGDGTGRVVAGFGDGVCGRALSAATQAGELIVMMFSAPAGDVYAGSVLPTVNGVRAGSVTLNAGTSNIVLGARVTAAPPTDTIGAQRLLVPTADTYAIALGQTRSIPIAAGSGAALVMHALGVSSSTTYPGGGYCIGDTETELSDALTNDIRFEWLSDDIAKVDVTLEVGVTTQRAFLVVLGWTR